MYIPEKFVPEPCLARPWRNMPENEDEILDFIKNYEPRNKETKHLRIMLHGPVGAGKSTFVNSVESAVRGRITGRALTEATATVSFTRKYKTYRIPKDKSSRSFCHFVFNDTMGLERHDNGIHVEDLKNALRGRVKEGHKFIPNDPLEEEDANFNNSPSLEDKIHVLVFVVPADTIALISDNVVRKFRDVRRLASKLDIPQMIIITKVDEACPEVKKDIKNIHKSKYLREQVEKVHQKLGIPENCIFLVKNYSSEIDTSTEMNVVILRALEQMINFGEDFLNNQ